jgi:hypothetical protein
VLNTVLRDVAIGAIEIKPQVKRDAFRAAHPQRLRRIVNGLSWLLHVPSSAILPTRATDSPLLSGRHAALPGF